jgi:hypothetical protein
MTYPERIAVESNFLHNPAAEPVLRTFLRVKDSGIQWVDTYIEDRLRQINLSLYDISNNPAFAKDLCAAVTKNSRGGVNWSSFSGNSHPLVVKTTIDHYNNAIAEEKRKGFVVSTDHTLRQMHILYGRNSLHWWHFSGNEYAPLDMLRENIADCSEVFLSSNPSAVPLLKEFPHMIAWEQLSENPAAMNMILANPDKMSWRYLSRNPHPIAIAMLEANQDKINWKHIGLNPGIFRPRIDPEDLMRVLTMY